MITSKTERRLPAEWEPQGAVLMAWPHENTDWSYMLDEAQDCYRRMLAAIAPHVPVILLAPATPDNLPGGVHVVNIDTNDTWTRDYGPLVAETNDGSPLILDFCFNGWGMKFAAGLDNLTTRKLIAQGVFVGESECHNDLVLEGGSIESDGEGTILTTSCCLMAPNRNEPLLREEITEELLRRLGARKVVWIDHGSLVGDDTDGHIDTLCRLAPHNTIIYTGCHNHSDEHYRTLSDMAYQLHGLTNADGLKFNLVELPLPDPIFDEDGLRLPATYANYLVVNDAVFMPTYNQPANDLLAADTLRVVFPHHKVVCVDCCALIKQHGSLHCATMQLPASIISNL